jgi:hypothetical protein
MEKIIFTIVFVIGFSMSLSNELKIVNIQENTQGAYSKTNTN